MQASKDSNELTSFFVIFLHLCRPHVSEQQLEVNSHRLLYLRSSVVTANFNANSPPLLLKGRRTLRVGILLLLPHCSRAFSASIPPPTPPAFAGTHKPITHGDIAQFLDSFPSSSIVITGATSGIGSSIVSSLPITHPILAISRSAAETPFPPHVTAISHDFASPSPLSLPSSFPPPSLIINCAAILNAPPSAPEKNIKSVDHGHFSTSMNVNCYSLISLYQSFLPFLHGPASGRYPVVVNLSGEGKRGAKATIFEKTSAAAEMKHDQLLHLCDSLRLSLASLTAHFASARAPLSLVAARVGSISDNRSGGW